MGCRGPTWLCLVPVMLPYLNPPSRRRNPLGTSPPSLESGEGLTSGAGDGISERKTSVLSKGETQHSTPPQDSAPLPSAGPPLPPQQPAHTFPIALYW